MDENRKTDGGRPDAGPHFIRSIVERHLDEGAYEGVVTRFPPEPNGFLHIGHAQSIWLNFGLAEEFGGRCHLRFDDTNPITEEARYAESMQRDIHWLGFDWGPHLYYASDYFERMYQVAEDLIRNGRAYVDSQTEEEIREGRGTVTEPGVNSPYRDRSVEENLDLLRRMRAGEFEDGAHVLRARADMASPNMVMRDPVLYRIRHAHHYRTGDDWCIYPLYDYAHCLEDAFEDVTHSVCTLEFDNNREIYDWLLEAAGFTEPRPHQYEFARLNVEYTLTSKRKLSQLVQEGHVSGWDDPRMPTVAGMRRRGVTPEAIRDFSAMVGVTKVDKRVDYAMFEHAVRNDLNFRVPRVMGVLRPLRVTITNYPEPEDSAGAVEWIDAPLYPRDVPLEGTRPVPFTRELFIDRDDFAEDPPKGFRRLVPGGDVRLRYAYVIRCDEVVKDPESGEVVELLCTYFPETRSGGTPDGRKVKGTIHWVSATEGVPATVRLYDRLFDASDPEDVAEGGTFLDNLNPESLVVLEDSMVEPYIGTTEPGTRAQFERQGYFILDEEESAPGRPVFNRTVTLRDSWQRRQQDPGDANAAPAAEAGKGSEITTSTPAEPKGESEGDASRRKTSGRSERDGARRADPALEGAFSRFMDDLDLPEDDADVLSGSADMVEAVEAALSVHDNARGVASWLVNEFPREGGGRSLSETGLRGEAVGRLVSLVDDGTLGRSGARTVFSILVAEGGDPSEIVEREGLVQVSDSSALEGMVDAVLARFPEKVEEYRAGKTGLLGMFMGQVMKESGGTADPQATRAILHKKLET